MSRAALARRLRLEYNLDRPSDCAMAIRLALSIGAGPSILDALRFRMARARMLREEGVTL